MLFSPQETLSCILKSEEKVVRKPQDTNDKEDSWAVPGVVWWLLASDFHNCFLLLTKQDMLMCVNIAEHHPLPNYLPSTFAFVNWIYKPYKDACIEK